MRERNESARKRHDATLFHFRRTSLGVGGEQHKIAIYGTYYISLNSNVFPPEVLAERLFAFLELHNYHLKLWEKPRLVACRLYLVAEQRIYNT